MNTRMRTEKWQYRVSRYSHNFCPRARFRCCFAFLSWERSISNSSKKCITRAREIVLRCLTRHFRQISHISKETCAPHSTALINWRVYIFSDLSVVSHRSTACFRKRRRGDHGQQVRRRFSHSPDLLRLRIIKGGRGEGGGRGERGDVITQHHRVVFRGGDEFP